MVREFLLPLAALILVFSALPASVIAGGPPTTCYPRLGLVSPAFLPGPPARINGDIGSERRATAVLLELRAVPVSQGFSINSNGSVTGTPGSAGTFTFNVVVSDSLKDNVTGALTLTVAALRRRRQRRRRQRHHRPRRHRQRRHHDAAADNAATNDSTEEAHRRRRHRRRRRRQRRHQRRHHRQRRHQRLHHQRRHHQQRRRQRHHRQPRRRAAGDGTTLTACKNLTSSGTYYWERCVERWNMFCTRCEQHHHQPERPYDYLWHRWWVRANAGNFGLLELV